MNDETACRNWRALAAASAVVLAAVTVIAAVTRVWVLTAIPVGVLFGFFLQKGDLCGASAFSELILMRDSRKVGGLAVLIVVSMGTFAALDLLSLIKLNPKPFVWPAQIAGGVVFGVGMVLAGGCVSGCLFKTGTGNINSMAALVGIPLGVAMVKSGPLAPIAARMGKYTINTAGGVSVSLPTVTHLPYWVLALVFVGMALLIAGILRRAKKTESARVASSQPFLKRALTRPWKPWQAGVAIGVLAGLAYLSSAASGRNYPLGVTGGVSGVHKLATGKELTQVWRQTISTKPEMKTPRSVSEDATQKTTPQPKSNKVVVWLVVLVVSLVIGSWISGRLSGQAKLLARPPEQTVIAFIGGVLVGVGAAVGHGCVVGNIMSGWALMSVGSILFGITAVLANWVTTYFYLMGGTLRGSGRA
jgi:uncharacterized membrane protein YedE/YeeE